MIKRRPGEITTLETRKESYDKVDKRKRYREIIEILQETKRPMTAKEISVAMYHKGYTPTSERNFSSPRITELLKNGTLDIVGKKRCKFTGKTVSVYELR